MAIRRRRGSGRLGRRRGRRLQQDGQVIVPANRVGRARAAALALGAVANVGRAAYNVYRANRANVMADRRRAARRSVTTERRMRRNASRVVGSKRTRGTEVTRSRARYGKKRRVTNSKLVMLAVPRRILRFGAVGLQDIPNVWNGTAGQQWPYSGITTPTSTGLAGRYPLTYIPNFNAGTADLMPYYVMRLYSSSNTTNRAPFSTMTIAPSGNVAFQTCLGVAETGVTSTQWRAEYVSGPNADIITSKRWIQPEWYDIRLVMYGCKTAQTQFIVEYVQLNDDHFDPEWDGASGAVGGRTEDLNEERNAWYQTQVRSLITNPIATPYNQIKRKGWRVLKSWKYTVDPHLTIESDTTPNSRVARIFIRDGRVLSYSTRVAEDSVTVDDDLRDPNKFMRRINTGWDVIDHPGSAKARRMLIIRSNNAISTTGAVTDDNAASFDLLVRKKESLSDV